MKFMKNDLRSMRYKSEVNERCLTGNLVLAQFTALFPEYYFHFFLVKYVFILNVILFSGV